MGALIFNLLHRTRQNSLNPLKELSFQLPVNVREVMDTELPLLQKNLNTRETGHVHTSQGNFHYGLSTMSLTWSFSEYFITYSA